MDAGPRFRAALTEFQQWCDEQYRQLALGKRGFPVNALFNSPVHDLLLNGSDAAFSGPTPVAEASDDTEVRNRERSAHC